MHLAQLGIVIGPKGRGSNMLAIARACAEGRLPARVRTVVSPVDGTPAVEAARAMDLKVAVVEPGQEYGDRLTRVLEGCDWICLAGYLRLLPEEVLARFPRRILNIHPALLPKYGGKGMYGLNVHRAVLDAAEQQSGATVHHVGPAYDEGEVIVQLTCPVLPGDTPESLAARVLEREHAAYVEALRKVLHG